MDLTDYFHAAKVRLSEYKNKGKLAFLYFVERGYLARSERYPRSVIACAFEERTHKDYELCSPEHL